MKSVSGRSSNIFFRTNPNGVGRSNTLNNKFNLNKAIISAPETFTSSEEINKENNILSQLNYKTLNLSRSNLKSGLLQADALRVKVNSLKII